MQETLIKYPLGQSQKSGMQLGRHFGDIAFRLQTSDSLHARSQLYVQLFILCMKFYLNSILDSVSVTYLESFITNGEVSRIRFNVKTVDYLRDIKYLYRTFQIYFHISAFYI